MKAETMQLRRGYVCFVNPAVFVVVASAERFASAFRLTDGTAGAVGSDPCARIALAVEQVALRSDASSGDGGGLSKDNAQDKVRQDILEADATMLADCINRKVAEPWSRFNSGVQAACPRLVFVTDPPEDVERAANVIKTMYDAGWEADQEEVSARLGFKFTRRADDQFGQIPTGDPVEGEDAHTLNLKQKYDAMGVAIRAGLLTATPEIEAQTRAELGLPAMSPEVRKAWEATGGIRQPITLKTAEAAAVSEALDVDGSQPDGELQLAESRGKDTPQSVLTWLGPVLDDLSDLADGPDEKLQDALGHGLPVRFGDSGGFEKVTVKTGLAAAAHGIAEQYDKVKRDGRVRSGKPVAAKASQSADGENLV